MHDFLQLRMKIEMGTRVVSVSTTEFALAEKTEEERMLSSKRRHSQLDVDSDDQDDAGASLAANQTEGDSAPVAKRARPDEGNVSFSFLFDVDRYRYRVFIVYE